MPPEREQQQAALLCRLDVARVERQRVVEGEQRLLVAVLLAQEIAEPDPDIDEVRFEREREIVALQRLFEPVAQHQQAAEIGEIVGIALVAADRLRDEIDREVDAIALSMNQAEQMQGVGMLRIRCERLAAAVFGHRKLTGMEVPQPRLVKRRGRVLCFAAAGHAPALADSPISTKNPRKWSGFDVRSPACQVLVKRTSNPKLHCNQYLASVL